MKFCQNPDRQTHYEDCRGLKRIPRATRLEMDRGIWKECRFSAGARAYIILLRLVVSFLKPLHRTCHLHVQLVSGMAGAGPLVQTPPLTQNHGLSWRIRGSCLCL